MNRVLYFLTIIFVPVIFSWWLFIPMALLSVYLIKLPFEIVVVGFLLDFLYYFGDGFFAKHLLTLFSLILIILALFLNKKVHWQKTI
ncbi:MAG: hypothetical protein A3A96_01770 [Candidatus Zambryskibacteria bacterium RIFCSPLOWO2_01_FULL_39_39]|uniref:Uncharacterized protein n=1 Tax=Candidatus Zambryskibacteria bacterium RIFCSPLOWO2_01_FULL_39_39 TaxID=1802758 RepID=A0A1G2TXV3_9BACT|nr:MAG: hypothetical protein A2644_01885 [Candidatus Zambryskibacteria bacterium RIFCSPHIGHO2_01_FULL_39_63]OHA94250.1 MAG: hypothetical protein A3B88_03830 [Candidatus Zambryskibacteria bacterium RIFCSPHIGHO2_02_FULL_39_19]OHA98483.1 MAG: hypothetical protein A3F20_03665 [Candidatus Zambryskibacteria bacterium RIFCSPHIGHO2_12_FULL_39_21]OHB01402.1 MAG: hypothetical protein A3A96_01770 [Candidatus Zambryskibacteria bacterium RIFCSPLOWO2_01_FULL_39_39]